MILKRIEQDNEFLRKDIAVLLEQCKVRQLEIIKKFIMDIVMTL